jgi:methyltransferase-like protein/SAM-dependent methyltransferase
MINRASSYDEVPYESHPFVQSHPDRLAAIASLLGVPSPPADHCRVLEIGCASGGNLVPMAEQLPDATFVGIDGSERQIEEGRRLVANLGLGNIKLIPCDIIDLPSDIGEFDYIICHGVFSWVPETAQEKILSICLEHLSPTGIAYISYNTYPGWHFRESIRHMMLFHALRFSEPTEQVHQARGLLDFLVKSASGESTLYAQFLRSELETLRRSSDSYLFHEHLEENNTPVYFSEFALRAHEHGLQFFAESDLNVMVPGNFPAEVQATLQRLSPDLIYIEQYMDFIRNRTFRQSLLCKAGRTPNYALNAKTLTPFWVAAAFRPQSAVLDLNSSEYATFESDRGISVRSNEPIVKAALQILGSSWPRRIRFDTLRAQARTALDSRAVIDAGLHDRDIDILGQALLRLYTAAGSNLLELALRPLAVAATPGEKPRAARLPRLQAHDGASVTNLRHQTIGLDSFGRELLMRLDGEHSLASLCAELAQMVSQGKLVVHPGGEEVREREAVEKALASSIPSQLSQFARWSLLMDSN